MSIDHEATTRVENARIELIEARKFYGVLVSNVVPVLSRKFPTMATDGKRHYYNPEFIMGLKKNHLGVEVHPQLLVLGVQAHESEHDARHHGTRRNGRDPEKWNIACDYSINIDLIDEGFHLPEGALIDPQYRGMSAEDIYRARELDEERKKPPEQPQDQEGNDDADTNPPQTGGDGDEQKDGDETPDDDLSDVADEDDGDRDHQDDADEDGDEGEGGDADADDGDEGESEGKGNGGDAGDDAQGKGTGSGDAEGDSEGEGESEGQASGDPGMCGQVLDSALDDDESPSDEEIKWERAVRTAASVAKGVGQLPGHISREIERANNPTREWRDELREFCEQGALRTETWNRPNRRFMGRGIVLPSTQKDGVSKAAFLIDTSGSCDDIALACVRDEAQALMDDGIIDEAVVIYGDTRVTRVDEFRTGDELEFDPRGGGGTDMEPLFTFVAEQHEDASLIICFTDLDFYKSCGDEPHCPVLFAVHGYPQFVKAKIEAGAPWGARAIDVGAH
jgi:predicted metal-dependent peptidase